MEKKDDSWRLCVYYRVLNYKTISNRFSIQVVEEFIDELVGRKVFSKIDLRVIIC